MASTTSVWVSPFCRPSCRWKGSCSVLPPATSAVIVTRLRSRGDSSLRFQTSPNRTSSVRETSLGAKSPSIVAAADCCGSSGMGALLPVGGAPAAAKRCAAAGGSAGGLAVLGVGDLFAPLGLRAALALGEAVPDGQVGHEVVRSSAVPVPLSRRAPHGVSGPDDDDVAAAGLGQADALGDVQGLAVGVPVPRGARPGGEVNRVDLAAGGGARGDDVEGYDPGEPLRRPLNGRLLAQDL